MNEIRYLYFTNNLYHVNEWTRYENSRMKVIACNFVKQAYKKLS